MAFAGLTVLTALVGLVSVGDLLLWRLVRRLERGDGGRGREAAAPADQVEKEPDPMDEGFQNLMRFSVKGKMGFSQEEE